MSPIRAVLFDLGDTLWHFPRMPSDQQIARESGRRIVAQLAAWGIGSGAGERLAIAMMQADRAATREAERSHGRSPDFAALLGGLLAREGISLDERRTAKLWDELHVDGPFLGRTVFPDSIPLIEELRSRGLGVGAVTNRSLGGPRFREELGLVAMDRIFDCMIVSADEGWLKPHRELFDLAVGALGVEHAETMMVGDDLFADVLGAKSLGMSAVWKRPPDRPQEPHPLPDGTLARPDWVIDRPGELLDLPPFTRS
ncbi:MAG: HAD-IA family hydrolase [Deltaproteobacteria bacterium]|nr:HAD-IA family hydrolase [Deltaproteobacteria bacterium]